MTTPGSPTIGNIVGCDSTMITINAGKKRSHFTALMESSPTKRAEAKKAAAVERRRRTSPGVPDCLVRKANNSSGLFGDVVSIVSGTLSVYA